MSCALREYREFTHRGAGRPGGSPDAAVSRAFTGRLDAEAGWGKLLSRDAADPR